MGVADGGRGRWKEWRYRKGVVGDMEEGKETADDDDNLGKVIGKCNRTTEQQMDWDTEKKGRMWKCRMVDKRRKQRRKCTQEWRN